MDYHLPLVYTFRNILKFLFNYKYCTYYAVFKQVALLYIIVLFFFLQFCAIDYL